MLSEMIYSRRTDRLDEWSMDELSRSVIRMELVLEDLGYTPEEILVELYDIESERVVQRFRDNAERFYN